MASPLATVVGTNKARTDLWAEWRKPPDTSSFFGQVGVLIHSDQQVLICRCALSVRPPAFVADPRDRRDTRVELKDELLVPEFLVERTEPLKLAFGHSDAARGDVLHRSPIMAMTAVSSGRSRRPDGSRPR
jgi:hypothetical protein